MLAGLFWLFEHTVEKTLDWLELLGPCSKFSEGNMIDWALVKDSLLVSQNVQIKQYAAEITASLFFLPALLSCMGKFLNSFSSQKNF